jgi:hypothetical protein
MIAHLFMVFNYFLKEVKIMLDKWTGEVVGTMHIYGISFTKLANQMGISNRYLSELLNSKRKPKDCEARIRAALMELIGEGGEDCAEAEVV